MRNINQATPTTASSAHTIYVLYTCFICFLERERSGRRIAARGAQPCTSYDSSCYGRVVQLFVLELEIENTIPSPSSPRRFA